MRVLFLWAQTVCALGESSNANHHEEHEQVKDAFDHFDLRFLKKFEGLRQTAQAAFCLQQEQVDNFFRGVDPFEFFCMLACSGSGGKSHSQVVPALCQGSRVSLFH